MKTNMLGHWLIEDQESVEQNKEWNSPNLLYWKWILMKRNPQVLIPVHIQQERHKRDNLPEEIIIEPLCFLKENFWLINLIIIFILQMINSIMKINLIESNKLISIFKYLGLGIIFSEYLPNKNIHWSWTTMNIHCIILIKWTNLVQNLLSHITCITFPIFISFVDNIMHFHSIAQSIELFSQNNIFFRFIGK